MTTWRNVLLIALGASVAPTLVLVMSLGVNGTDRADAAIHEIIGAGCRAGGEDVEPPGQVTDGLPSLVRALQATGVIESIDETATAVTINFDLDKPSSKFMSAGFDLTIPDGIAPGVDLVLSPLPIPDPDFAAHAHCANLNP